MQCTENKRQREMRAQAGHGGVRRESMTQGIINQAYTPPNLNEERKRRAPEEQKKDQSTARAFWTFEIKKKIKLQQRQRLRRPKKRDRGPDGRGRKTCTTNYGASGGVRILDNPKKTLAVVLNLTTGVITRRNEDKAALILQCKPCSRAAVQVLDEIVESGAIRLLLRLEVKDSCIGKNKRFGGGEY